MKKVLLIIMLALLTASSAVAQLRGQAPRRERINRERYERSRYADVADLRLRAAGTLEEELGPVMEKQVRLLIIDGQLNNKDLQYIQKLCRRSKVFGADGKEVDNYIDIDMSRTRINNGGSFFTSTNRDVLSSNMFSSCSHLRSIVLPDRLRLIDRGAFRNCYDLEDVVLPRGLEAIGDEAFYGCNELINVYLPDGMTTVGNSAFNGCTRLRNIYIPSSIFRIGDRAFEKTAVTDIYLPDRLEYLGAGAFNGSNLRSLYIPRLTEIGNNDLGKLANCSEIIVDPDNRYYTTEGGALYDRNLTTLLAYPTALRGVLYVPDGVQRIANYACYNCEGLSAVELPGSVTSIGAYAFAGCKSLRSIDLPSRCTNFGKAAFLNTPITSINLPQGTTVIREDLFKDCVQLTHIDIPESVNTIETDAFHNCRTLQAVVIPDGVVSLPKSVFEGCNNLASVKLGNGLKEIGEYTFKKCKQLREVIMPASLRTIGKNAFRDCDIAHLELNEGLLSIGDNAFSENQLIEFVIPSTVSHIGKKVAEKNKQLGRIVCRGAVPAKLDKVSNDKVALIVPADAVNNYKQADNWKKFKNIIGQ
ncbi:MAG: leucine-rich repeat domain-containing protein [Bacteroidales bacterium]|nr:leucine-rich repeat domain-containing protein [Candidatus Sodaliphilus limicaballi]